MKTIPCVLIYICVCLCLCMGCADTVKIEPIQKCYDMEKYPVDRVNKILSGSGLSEDEFCDLSEGVKHLLVFWDISKIDLDSTEDKVYTMGLLLGLTMSGEPGTLQYAASIARDIEKRQANSNQVVEELNQLEQEAIAFSKAPEIKDGLIEDWLMRYTDTVEDTLETFSGKNKRQENE